MPIKTLIFVPTYNESENAPRMCAEIHKLGLDADVLFVDDNSPDGTGQALDELKSQYPRLIVHHRAGKLGIGSAHFEAIQWAYDQGYETLITLDCDFTHSPSDIPAMLATLVSCEVAVGSRWVNENSLPGWNFFRRFMTWGGHQLTKTVLGMPYDASGAFRAYRLDRMPREIFQLVKSRGYSFFFESLFIFVQNGVAIREVPIVLPARTYGHSKMSPAAALKSLRYVFSLALANLRKPEQFLVERALPDLDPKLVDPQQWDRYWNEKADMAGSVFELIAGIYRRTFIKPALERAIRRVFSKGAQVLHAGCGSGQVDRGLHQDVHTTALDISPAALRLYSRNSPTSVSIKHGSIFSLPFPEATFDGIYNLGVMEHFTSDEIRSIFQEFRRVLKPGGRILIFWPMACAPSVLVLNLAHFILNKVCRLDSTLHPPEVSLLRSRLHAEGMLSDAAFLPEEFSFGWRDLFTQAIAVARKAPSGSSPK